MLVVLSLATGAIFAVGVRLLGRVTPPPALGWALLAVIVVVLAAAAAFSHPDRRLESFKQFPGVTGQPNNTVGSHLVSGSGSGRWQFWAAALREWESAPVVGRGAGSYEAWWAEHAPFSYFVRNAHSLYLEVLGELGLVGLLILVSALVYGAVVAVRNTLRRKADERVVAASLLGVVAAFYLGAGLEWIWQIPVVTGVGILSLGLLTGPAGASDVPRPVAIAATSVPRRIPRFAIGLGALAVGWFVLCAQAVPWLADIQLKASAVASEENDGRRALRHALDGKSIQPWAASPYLQLALVDEQRGDLDNAHRWIESAIDRNPIDWRLWLVAARLETKAGDVPTARKSLMTAERLNPRSPLFRQPG
jgi:hypothetical protein